jgi:Saccharopine dehydrogenase NADP binding domain
LPDRVLVIGGYGVFGGRLARRLMQDTNLDVVVAGRSFRKAAAFVSEWGGTPYGLDRDSDEQIDRALADLSPSLVIDAAGPFQAYGADPLGIARKTIAAGAHYLDLADDRRFVLAIAALDGPAKARGVCAIAGASTIPALSAAAADALAADLRCPAIEIVIVPGNQAPRGLSLIRAILAQVGQPLRVWRAGRWSRTFGWGEPRTVRLSMPGAEPLPPRWASLIGAPDYDLFPKRYGASSVLFRAGVELKVLHGGLWLLSWLVRFKIVNSLLGLAQAAQFVADLLKSIGTDRGGMAVTVAGRDAAGRAVRRTWMLIAEAGDGPSIPATPAFIVARKIFSGAVASGARPCLDVFTLDEAEAPSPRLRSVLTGTISRRRPCSSKPWGRGFIGSRRRSAISTTCSNAGSSKARRRFSAAADWRAGSTRRSRGSRRRAMAFRSKSRWIAWRAAKCGRAGSGGM